MQHVLNNVFFALGDNGCFIQVFLGVNMSFSKENNLILIRVIYEHNIINTEQDRTECGYKVNLFIFIGCWVPCGVTLPGIASW